MGNGKSRSARHHGMIPEAGAAPKSYFAAIANKPSAETVPVPHEKPIGREEAFAKFRQFARNWDEGLESAFAMPPSVFFYQSSQALFFSSEPNKSVIATLRGMQIGKMHRPESEYGIIVEQGTSAIYLTLVDARRRIAVRGMLMNYEKAPPEGDWLPFKASLMNAVSAAEGAHAAGRGLFAVSDCSPEAKLMAPEGVSPGEGAGRPEKPPGVRKERRPRHG